MKTPFALSFSRRLTAAMTVAGLPTAASLARLLGVQESRARNWCNGTGTPTAQESVRLAHALSVTLDWLYRERTEGLEEGRRIRLVAAMEGITPPFPVLPSTDGQQEEAPVPAADAAAAARRRARVANA